MGTLMLNSSTVLTTYPVGTSMVLTSPGRMVINMPCHWSGDTTTGTCIGSVVYTSRTGYMSPVSYQ